MKYRILYHGSEICRVETQHQLTLKETVLFVFPDFKAACENGVPGFFRTETAEYQFDYDGAALRACPEEEDTIS